MRIFNKRNFIVGSMALIAMAAVGFVYAAWTTNGSGSGYAQAGSAQSLTTAVATTSATLYPGVNGDVELVIKNPNPYAVRVTNVTQTSGQSITADATHVTAGCTTANNAVTFTAQNGLTVDLPAAVGGTPSTTSKTLTGAAHMGNSDNTCQGATFTIPVDLTGVSTGS
jgi:hypothetical protein